MPCDITWLFGYILRAQAWGIILELIFGEDPSVSKGISILGEFYDVDSEDEGNAVDDDDSERLNNQENVIRRV